MHYLSAPLVHFLLFLSTATFVEEQKHSFDAILMLYYVFFNALYTILQCEISLPNIVLHNVVTGNFPFFKYLRQVCHPYFYAPKHDLRTFVTGNVLHILYGLPYAFVCMCYGQL